MEHRDMNSERLRNASLGWSPVDELQQQAPARRTKLEREI